MGETAASVAPIFCSGPIDAKCCAITDVLMRQPCMISADLAFMSFAGLHEMFLAVWSLWLGQLVRGCMVTAHRRAALAIPDGHA